MIDWTRVAEPQADQYDTLVALHYANTRTWPKRPDPYHRRPVGDRPAIFDGRVAVRRIAERCPGYPDLDHGPLSHPNIDQAAEYLKNWPVVYEQFAMLMDSFHPMVYHPKPGDRYGEVGSFSHNDDDKFATMYATVFDALGLAQAFVHEMAHNKLRGMGLFTEDTAGFIRNPRDQLFESPVIKTMKRPMTAVFHAEYSFTYVTQLDIAMIGAETEPKKLDRWHMLLERNLPRIEEGLREMREHIELDEKGEGLMEGFYPWVSRVIEDGHALLKQGQPA